MRKTLLVLCLSAFTAFNSNSQSSLALNDALISTKSSTSKRTESEVVYLGTKRLSSTNGFCLTVDASTSVFNDGTEKRRLEYLLSNGLTNTSVYISDKNVDGLSIGDYLVLNHHFSNSYHFRITMSYPRRYQFITSAELFDDGKSVSKYIVGTQRRSKIPIISEICDWINRRVVEPKLEEFCEKGNLIYFDAVANIIEDKFPERIPYDSFESALRKAELAMQRVKTQERASLMTSVLFDSLSESFANQNSDKAKPEKLELVKEQ